VRYLKNVKIHRNIILSAVLYGCKPSSFFLRKELTRRMFENRVLRKTSGRMRKELTIDSKVLHSAEFSEFYYEQNVNYKFNVRHPEVFNTYINIQWCISQTQHNSWNTNIGRPSQTTTQSNASISETVQNRTHVHINIFAQNDRYYNLPEYWPFLLGHPLYVNYKVH